MFGALGEGLKAWVVKLLGGLSASAHSSLDFAQLGNGLISSGKSWSPHFATVITLQCGVLGSHVSRVLSAASQHARKSVVNVNSVVKLVGGTVQQLLCLKVTAR